MHACTCIYFCPLFVMYFVERCMLRCSCVWQDHTRVGADTSQDIQLFGIGIQSEHSVIDISSDGDITLTPVNNAR